eukprot:m.285592 g.285592  ORF g.285592 m.285592 type:complete len:399 (+) comp11412_c0_seq1:265-1461(+)
MQFVAAAMAFPDDPYSHDELFAQILNEAHEFITMDKSPYLQSAEAEEAGSDEYFVLTPQCAGRLAQTVAKAVMDSDLANLEATKMGGVQLYDTRRVTEAVQTALYEIADDWRENDKFELVTAPGVSKPPYEVDIFTDQGRRSQMEDKHVAFTDLNAVIGREDLPDQAFFGVYDGHGGAEAAKFTQANLHLTIAKQDSFKDSPLDAMRAGFLETDKDFLKKADRDGLSCGATACAVLIRGKKLYIAWLGDSQAMMVRAGKPVALMDPHKPQREDEKKRIEDNGGVVVWYGAWRVNGVLSVARAIGDKKLKQWVIGDPDVAEFDLDGTEEYLILGCDGLWDVMDNDKVTEFIAEWRKSHESMQGVAKALVQHCIETLSGSDNISIIIAFFEGSTVSTDQS